VLSLEPLSEDERSQVVRTGLQQAATKNGFETVITEEALELICELSEGYPHFIQQFAFAAFAEDSDNTIDAEDVRTGSLQRKWSVVSIGGKIFQ
jgi:type II secretory pathway predicted ATPase ExeA